MLLCVLTTSCNPYSRLWCLFEIFTAVQLGVEVNITSRQSGRYGLGALEDALLKLCEEHIDSSEAECGVEGLEMGCGSIDKAAIRNAIDASPGGHRAVDIIVEESRLAALIRGRDRLTGGGWKDTTIGRQYQDAINMVSVRVGKVSIPSPKADAAMSTPSVKPRRLNKAWSDASLVSAERSPPTMSQSGMSAGIPKVAAPPPSANGLGPPALPTRSSSGTCHAGGAGAEDKRLGHLRGDSQSTPRTNTRQHWCPTTSL